MNDDSRRILGFLAAQFVFLAALIHLTLGVMGWIEWLRAGFLLPRDLRWPVFVGSALAILGGTYHATRAEAATRRRLCAAGIVVMAGYAVGYFLWHLTGHRPLLVLGSGAGTEAVSVAWFLDHLFAGPAEFAALLFETLATVALAALLADGDGS
ncbi:MAG: hypothetical protein ABEH56_00635 [Salinirussus sp.]